MTHFLYFGRISDVTGCTEEDHDLPADVTSIPALRHWLDTRFGATGALQDLSVRIALDSQIALEDQALSAPREIALMPPVGGG